MTVVDPEGNDVTPQKLRDYQERSKKTLILHILHIDLACIVKDFIIK